MQDRIRKPHLILIPGYGATALMYYKIIEHLRLEFRLTTLDLLGLGCSGRPKFNLTTSRDCISYYVYSLEAWFRKQDSISLLQNGKPSQEKIILMGHSLGAFVAVHYALTFP